MHRYRDNKGRFVSSKDSKTTPPPLIQLTLVQGKIPPRENSRGASEAPEGEPKMKESALGWAECESVEHLGDTENPVYEPSISGMVEEEGNAPTETKTFRFPILDISRNINMKNIPLSSLPTFRGMSTEDPDLFLFEFDILCRSYNYLDDAQKIKLFLATMKDSSLRWFMSLGENMILPWDQMKDTFLRKYQDYCKDNAKNDIFKMQQTEDESPEDYLERFLYNYQKSKLFTTDPAVVRTIFLKGLRDDCIEVLNLLS
jgi:hypothetical protein